MDRRVVDRGSDCASGGNHSFAILFAENIDTKRNDIMQTIYSNAYNWIEITYLIQISAKLVSHSPINNKSILVKAIAWCRMGATLLLKQIMN